MSESQPQLLPWEDSFTICVNGSDAANVVNNLCTNDLSTLAIADCCEAFITNLRGWIVGHVVLHKLDGQIKIYGQHPEPEKICDHINRYIIREDAEAALEPTTSSALWVGKGKVDVPIKRTSADTERVSTFTIDGLTFQRLPCKVAGAKELWIFHEASVDEFVRKLDVVLGATAQQNYRRVLAGWPMQGREITEKSLPQEMDRDKQSISFTKGCYLGQETIARLDALGQLQKKLVVLKLSSIDKLKEGDEVSADGKAVGTLTSLGVPDAGRAHEKPHALAVVKRGHFDKGTQLEIGALSAQVVKPSP